MPSDWPQVAVIVGTRNRPQDLPRAVSSLLSLDYPAFKVLVIDQSDTGDKQQTLDRFRLDSRLTVIASSTVGLARARNLGCRATAESLLAFTDDDCEASPNWLRAMVEPFRRDPKIGVVFGCVRAPAYDRAQGFIPAYEIASPHVVSGLANKATVEGIGASMALRRAVWESLGGFDELLGAGACFRSGEDSDFAMRALARHYSICETPDAVVSHHGFRPWRAGNSVVGGYMYGLGAVYAKMLRLGGLTALRPTAGLAWRWLARKPVVDLNHVPGRALRLRHFAQGYAEGLTLGIDKFGRFQPASFT